VVVTTAPVDHKAAEVAKPVVAVPPQQPPHSAASSSHGSGLKDPDVRQKMANVVFFTIEMYKAVMTCLLALFVPQKCKGDPNSGKPLLQVDHTCGVVENLANSTSIQVAVIVWNFLTLGVICFHYALMLRRENYFVEYLDEDDALPDNNLETVLDAYPAINEGLAYQNKHVFTSAAIGMFFLLVNAVISGLLVFDPDHFDGFRTATVFATNLLLLVLVFKTCASNAWVGIQKRIALSCVGSEPISFNKIDHDHMHDDNNTGTEMAATVALTAAAPLATAAVHPPTVR
jgi:hypothetical protein